MALAGKSFVLKVATDAIGDTYYAVDEISNASMSVGADNLDITNFTATYRERIQGLKDVTYSLSGTYDSGDTNGLELLKALEYGSKDKKV